MARDKRGDQSGEEKRPIRMIAIDLDGTLLNSQSQISEIDLSALEAASARGIEVVPITGRNYYAALSLVQTLPFNLTLVATNGAIVRSLQGETHARRLLARETALSVLRQTEAYRPYTVVMFDRHDPEQFQIELPAQQNGGATLLPPEAATTSSWARRNQEFIQLVPKLVDAMEGDPLEVSFRGPIGVMRDLLMLLREKFPDAAADGHHKSVESPAPEFCIFRTEYPQRDFAMVDVIDPGCSKGRALEYWSRERKIRREEIMAIGDNFNDLEMLRYAGLPVVMDNADATLKAEGWAQTLDCDSGGVAHAIAQYVL